VTAPGGRYLREPLLLLFLDVVAHVFDQDGRLAVEAFVLGFESGPVRRRVLTPAAAGC
jgi:hypothetical protein